MFNLFKKKTDDPVDAGAGLTTARTQPNEEELTVQVRNLRDRVILLEKDAERTRRALWPSERRASMSYPYYPSYGMWYDTLRYYNDPALYSAEKSELEKRLELVERAPKMHQSDALVRLIATLVNGRCFRVSQAPSSTTLVRVIDRGLGDVVYVERCTFSLVGYSGTSATYAFDERLEFKLTDLSSATEITREVYDQERRAAIEALGGTAKKKSK